METPFDSALNLSGTTKRIAQRLFVIAENRLQLAMVEAQEERERILLVMWMALGAAAFGLLAGIALTVLIAVALWEHSPIMAMLVLTAIYAIVAGLFYWRLVQLQKNWQTFPATLEQLKKDRECLEKNLI